MTDYGILAAIVAAVAFLLALAGLVGDWIDGAERDAARKRTAPWRLPR